MKTLTRTMAAIAMATVAICVKSAASAAGLYEMPVYADGTFDPASPTSATAVGTNSAVLVFHGLTLSDVKAKLGDGYEIFAYFLGENSNANAEAKKVVPMCQIEYWPSEENPTKIYGQFNKLIKSSSRYYVKGFGVVLTEADDGVYAQAVGAANTQQAINTNPTEIDYLTVDSSTGEATFSTGGDKTITTTASSAGANVYFLSGVQMAAFVPAESSILAFEGLTVAELAQATSITCSLGGRNSNHYSASAASHGYIMTGYNLTTTDDGLRVEFQYKDGTTLYCVVALFTAGDSGVNVKALKALSTTGQDAGYAFANSDGTYNGTAYDSVATGYYGQYLGIYGIKATLPSYETAADSVGKYIVTNETTLVWSGMTLERLKSLVESGNYRIGALFNGGAIGNYADCEGAACNPTYDYDENNTLTNIGVQMQFRDGVNVKSVKVSFTETDSSIYAQAVGAAGKETHIGYSFTDTDYEGTRKVSSSAGNADYGVHDFFIVPVTKLDADADWTGLGEVALGNAVIDLNGHTLTVAGLSSTGSHVQVFNSAYSTTAKLVFDIADGETWTNSTVQIGLKTVEGDNIQVGKTGAGTLVVTKGTRIGTSAYSFGYTGGTLVSAGTLKPGATMLNRLFGYSDGVVTVCTNATFDVNGQGGGMITDVVLAGGTFANTVSNIPSAEYRFKKISLTADSTIQGNQNIGLYYADGDAEIDLGGYKLTATIASGKSFYLKGKNKVTIKNGTFEISGAGTLDVDTPVTATNNVSLVVNCKLDLGNNAFDVKNYTCGYAGTANAGTGVLSVYGTFKPTTAYFYGSTLQPGATIDVSGWTGDFPIASSATAGTTAISFNDAAAGTIYVVAGDEEMKGTHKIVAWESKPSNLVFRRPDGLEYDYSVWPDDDGLYAGRPGLIIIFK